MRKLKELKGIRLIALCAAVIILLWLAANTIDFAREKVARARGELNTVTLSADDFELVGIARTENGQYTCTDGDPQLILKDVGYITSIAFNCSFSVAPGEMVVYYAEDENCTFSAAKRYWLFAEQENCYTADMPVKKVYAIRLDPTSIAGNVMDIESIVINGEKPFLSYFAVTFREIFRLMVYAGLLAAVITVCGETLQEILKRFFKKG